MTGFVSFVGSGPGDPELLTLKAVDRLKRADAVLFDDLSSGPILEHARQGADLVGEGVGAVMDQRFQSVFQVLGRGVVEEADVVKPTLLVFRLAEIETEAACRRLFDPGLDGMAEVRQDFQGHLLVVVESCGFQDIAGAVVSSPAFWKGGRLGATLVLKLGEVLLFFDAGDLLAQSRHEAGSVFEQGCGREAASQ